tara:strand:+ start:7776 stop:9077 length:1302 start_codon:yes stop_codon:yes gene_type:complete
MNRRVILKTESIEDLQLETAYKAVSDTYRGTGIDIQKACKKQREEGGPVYKGDFVAQFGVPTNAGLQQGTRPTFTIFDYKDVMAVMRDSKTYTSGFIAEGLGAFFDGLIILAMDGDQHRQVRSLLQPAFMPEAVNKWRPEIEAVMRRDFLEPLAPKKKADIMEFGLFFPIRVMYALMGFPTDDPEKYKKYAAWALAMVGGNQIDPTKIEEARRQAGIAVKSLYDSILEVVQERRASNEYKDDLIGRLIVAEFEGRTLDDHEIVTFVRSLLPAAGETTTRTLSCVLTMLFNTPGLLDRVRDDRTLIPKLIDETVRYEPMGTFRTREAAKDTEIQGVKIPKGSFVQSMIVSANRDDTVFENGHEFDIDRKMKPSFGFGFGPHMCIGQFVAKLEMNCALNAMFDLLPNLRLDPDYPAPVIEGAQLRGCSSIHLMWD